MKKPTPNKDHEQSWRAFKGKNLEKLVAYIIKDEVENLGLKIVDGNKLERTKSDKLSLELSSVKHNLLVDYGEFGSHLSDVDIIIYDPKTYRIIASYLKQSYIAGKNCPDWLLENPTFKA